MNETSNIAQTLSATNIEYFIAIFAIITIFILGYVMGNQSQAGPINSLEHKNKDLNKKMQQIRYIVEPPPSNAGGSGSVLQALLGTVIVIIAVIVLMSFLPL